MEASEKAAAAAAGDDVTHRTTATVTGDRAKKFGRLRFKFAFAPSFLPSFLLPSFPPSSSCARSLDLLSSDHLCDCAFGLAA